MEQPDPNLHLSRINTLWTQVAVAHLNGDEARDAQGALLERYGSAIRRYLRAATRDSDLADDLYQEFVVRFLDRRLRGADPGRGRFRDYIKAVLFNLVADHYGKAKRRPIAMSPENLEPAVDPVAEQEQELLNGWREELMARAWLALEEYEKSTGRLSYTVLRYKADHVGAKSEEMADALGRTLGRELSFAGVRQSLHRARKRYAELLVDEIRHSIADPTPEAVEEEVIELGLEKLCELALKSRETPDQD